MNYYPQDIMHHEYITLATFKPTLDLSNRHICARHRHDYCLIPKTATLTYELQSRMN